MLFASLKTSALIALLCFSPSLYAGIISKHEAATSAQRAYSGRVLSVKQKNSVYKVKILTRTGQVRVVRVNAKNGQLK